MVEQCDKELCVIQNEFALLERHDFVEIIQGPQKDGKKRNSPQKEPKGVSDGTSSPEKPKSDQSPDGRDKAHTEAK